MKENNGMEKIAPEVRESLKNLGFTDYYVNIYCGLLEQGEMNANDLSKLTNVPYSRIYEILNEMAKKGIITKKDGRPSTFISNHPNEVFKELKEQMDQSFNENMSTSLPFLEEIFEDKGFSKNVPFTVVQGTPACMKHIKNMLNATNRKLCFHLTNTEFVFTHLKENIEFMHTKGVEIIFYISETPANLENGPKFEPYGKIKWVSSKTMNIIISDEKEGIQFAEGFFNITAPAQTELLLLSSTQNSVIAFLHQFLNNLME